MIIFDQRYTNSVDLVNECKSWTSIGSRSELAFREAAPCYNIKFDVSSNLTELSEWFNENIDKKCVMFNVFNHVFYLKNEEDVVLFKLRWL